MKKTCFLSIVSVIGILSVLPAQAEKLPISASITQQSINPYESRNKEFNDSFNEARKRIIESNLRSFEIKEDRENDISYEIDELKTDENYKLRNFIFTHNPKIKLTLANNIVDNVNKYSKESNLDPKLVLALMAKESSFRTSVVSTSGAIGLGQLKRGTALEVGVSNPFNAIENIKGTTRYLSKLFKTFNGDVNKALASYNMGPGALKRTLQAGKSLPPDVSKYVSKIKNFKSTI